MYYNGKQVEQDYEKAYKYIKQAADQGDYDAQIQLGTMYANGRGIDKSYELAIEWCSKAASSTDSAKVTLGEMYHTADEGVQNFSKALEWYGKVTQDGENKHFALRGIGLLFEHGDGVEQDFKEAFNFYSLSANDANKAAYYNIGQLYYYGLGVEQSYADALDWFHKAVDDGEPDEFSMHVLIEPFELREASSRAYKVVPESVIYGEVQLYLALMYQHGQGVDIDHQKAIEYLQSAANNGVESAQRYLNEIHC
jgi:TPR repeat protein